MFALGMSYSDMRQHVDEMYGLDVSQATISCITNRLIPEMKEWQQRPLDEVYSFVWLDAIHYQVNDNGRYVSKAVYSILGLKYVASKNRNAFMNDFKPVYHAATKDEVKMALDELEAKWGSLYPLLLQA